MTQQGSPVNWIKRDDGAGGTVEVADLGRATAFEITMQFDAQPTGGFGGGLMDRYRPADPDLVAGIGAGDKMVDIVDPKTNPTGKRINGAVQCGPDASGSGLETVKVDITRMHEEDHDINAIVVGGFCPGKKGFGRVAGVTIRVYDATPGQTRPDGTPLERRHLANVRFDISSTESAVLACSLHQLADGGWEIRNQPRYGRATTVADLGNLFRTALR